MLNVKVLQIETRQKKMEAVQRLELHTIEDEEAERREWIAERELFAPGCGEFDFEEDEPLPITPVLPTQPKNLRGEGPSLSDIVGVKLHLSQQPAPPLSPLKFTTPMTAKTQQPCAATATQTRKRTNDIEDIFI